MTKKEVMERINKISNMIADAQSNAEDLSKEIKNIERELEDLPEFANEIEDDEEGE